MKYLSSIQWKVPYNNDGDNGDGYGVCGDDDDGGCGDDDGGGGCDAGGDDGGGCAADKHLCISPNHPQLPGFPQYFTHLSQSRTVT